MKRTFLLLIGFMQTVLCSAGDKAIALQGKTWELSRVLSQMVNYVYDVKQWIDGDTIVDGRLCKKLYTLTTTEDERVSEKTVLEVGYCRQEAEKFYKDGELMFDFGMNEGDVFRFGEEEVYAIVTHVGDTTLMDGVVRKCLTLHHYHPEWDVITQSSDKWIEGIGSLESGVYTNTFMFAGYKTTLLGCRHGDTVIYEQDKSSRMETLREQSNIDNHSPIYDLTGRRLDNVPEKGVYIQGGKKRIVE